MLDIDTLRIIHASLAVCVFGLVYFGTYRATRAPYAFWWAGVVVLSSLSSAMYLLDTTAMGSVAAALGHGISPIAAAFAWAAARSLSAKTTAWWQLYPAGLLVFGLAIIDNRDDGTLPGTEGLLAAMAVLFGLAARELWRFSRDPRVSRHHEHIPGVRASVMGMAVASTVVASFYGLRLLVFLTAGPSSDFYVTWTGPVATAMLILATLVVVTHTVGSLSQFESSHEWRRRATYDDLTGLLARNAFMERATVLLSECHAEGRNPTLVLADFDRFKEINDEYGHFSGDRALEAFGDACHRLLSVEDLACRLGGDEFALVLAHSSVDDAQAFTDTLSALFAALVDDDTPCPTLSFGITTAERAPSLTESLRYADEALYQAKHAGGNQSVVFAGLPRT